MIQKTIYLSIVNERMTHKKFLALLKAHAVKDTLSNLTVTKCKIYNSPKSFYVFNYKMDKKLWINITTLTKFYGFKIGDNLKVTNNIFTAKGYKPRKDDVVKKMFGHTIITSKKHGTKRRNTKTHKPNQIRINRNSL